MAKKQEWDARSTPLWKTVKAFVVDIYRITNDGYFDSEPISRTNLRQSSLTLLGNVSQGLEAPNPGGSTYYFRIAYNSAVRLHALLTIQEDLGSIEKEKLDDLTARLMDIKVQVSKLEFSIKKKRKGVSSKPKK
ncbi:four helix bundle protein [Candidatus Dojkabacteria bacterium]|nr:four helix bundle protein [Candidatus Dojkabacteria bacterium]